MGVEKLAALFASNIPRGGHYMGGFRKTIAGLRKEGSTSVEHTITPQSDVSYGLGPLGAGSSSDIDGQLAWKKAEQRKRSTPAKGGF